MLLNIKENEIAESWLYSHMSDDFSEDVDQHMAMLQKEALSAVQITTDYM